MSGIMHTIRCFFILCPEEPEKSGKATVETTRRLMRELDQDWDPVRQRIERERRANPDLATAMEQAIQKRPDLVSAMREARLQVGKHEAREEEISNNDP